MRHAARAPPPPILKLGVLVHAFVAVAGVLQNGKFRQCNVAVEIYEGFWQFLIVRCGCSPFRDLQKVQQEISENDTKIFRISSKFHQKSTKMTARSDPRAILEASRFQERENELHLMLFFGSLTPLGRFCAPFWAPADPKGGPKITLFRKKST